MIVLQLYKAAGTPTRYHYYEGRSVCACARRFHSILCYRCWSVYVCVQCCVFSRRCGLVCSGAEVSVFHLHMKTKHKCDPTSSPSSPSPKARFASSPFFFLAFSALKTTKRSERVKQSLPSMRDRRIDKAEVWNRHRQAEAERLQLQITETATFSQPRSPLS